jgi:hypothetical protein
MACFRRPAPLAFVTRTFQGAAMPTISVRRASAADRPMLERLWLMFRHDMSEFGGQLPNPNGTRVATELVGHDWTEERRAVPGRPGLPPDSWISFTAGQAAYPSPRPARPPRNPAPHSLTSRCEPAAQRHPGPP